MAGAGRWGPPGPLSTLWGMGGQIRSGVERYDGSWFALWYGWASRGKDYREGRNRFLKVMARRDADRLAEKIARLP